MTASADRIRASYKSCRQTCRRAGSSFTMSFLLLPRAKRRAMEALYAFMRHTDDLADGPQPANVRAETLRRWRAALDDALANFSSADSAGQALLPALTDTVHRFQIPPEHLWAVIEGVEMDLTPRRYETFDELEPYCRRVASAVGLACVYVWGFRGHEALERAGDCGIALQLTNILRDLKEDAQGDRVYLPLGELRESGYSVDELKGGVVNDPFRRLMSVQVQRAERYYRQGAPLLDSLEPDGRRVFGVIMATYRALLERIKRRPGEVLRRRIGLSRARKLRIAVRWTLLPPRVAALL
ncbi:MAG: hypothetical protein A2V70_10705 [Planctomycetes bacterium RBG_13_63_9]|nr:MAG: hypothetical protein A2V70_10705 [Planctomycetes bacterium RBG_13_63_9]